MTRGGEGGGGGGGRDGGRDGQGDSQLLQWMRMRQWAIDAAVAVVFAAAPNVEWPTVLPTTTASQQIPLATGHICANENIEHTTRET